ncbi:MAG TPA: hypothetical protein VFQ70_03935 [Candidatus Saccharimonadaceae bacterium]|nr:hypothetical protein [Candidatus Saccharimonadaceae bacterium]
MRTSKIISPATVTALGFTHDMHAYPTRMEWQGKTYHFLGRGIRMNIRRGEKLMSAVTCSDGEREFYFRFAAGAWTLTGVG